MVIQDLNLNLATFYKEIIIKKGACSMSNPCCIAGADSGFQVKGGTLKKIVPSGGRCEKFGGILCEKSQFYAKKSYFFQF